MERNKHKELINHTKEALEKQLHRWNISAEVIGREKHLFSIYRKLLERPKNFAILPMSLPFASLLQCRRLLPCIRLCTHAIQAIG